MRFVSIHFNIAFHIHLLFLFHIDYGIFIIYFLKSTKSNSFVIWEMYLSTTLCAKQL